MHSHHILPGYADGGIAKPPIGLDFIFRLVGIGPMDGGGLLIEVYYGNILIPGASLFASRIALWN